MFKDNVFSIFARYIIALLLGFFGLSLIYFIFTPLTLYPSYLLLKLFYPSLELIIENSTFILLDYSIGIIDACVAGSAYLLLFILNLITPMSFKTRLKSILFMCFTFLIINIIRIVVFSSLYFSDFKYFDLSHRYVWYLGSTLIVVLVWFFTASIFKIKSIPGYTDLINIYSNTKSKRKSF